MDAGIIPAIISFFLPGIGQAATTGRPTAKWIVVFIILLIINNLLNMYLGIAGSVICSIISIVMAYDAYADKIQI